MDELLKWLSDSSSFVSTKLCAEKINPDSVERGIFANQPIEAGETLIHIRPSQLLNKRTALRTIALSDRERFSSLTSVQLIAVVLCKERAKGEESEWASFIKSLPTDSSWLPVCWAFADDDLQASIHPGDNKHSDGLSSNAALSQVPEYVRSLISRQRRILVKDYEEIVKSEPLLKFTDFCWAWQCINSRCLYMDLGVGDSKADNLTLAPFIDFLNHSSEDHCLLKSDLFGMKIISRRRYAPGDEVYLRYGAHDNAFLLTEYGFALPHNEWDFVDVTGFVIRQLQDNNLSEFVKEIGYWGDYTISKAGPSFRVEVACAFIIFHHNEGFKGLLKAKAIANGLMAFSREEERQYQELVKTFLNSMKNQLADCKANVTDVFVDILLNGWIALCDQTMDTQQGESVD